EPLPNVIHVQEGERNAPIQPCGGEHFVLAHLGNAGQGDLLESEAEHTSHGVMRLSVRTHEVVEMTALPEADGQDAAKEPEREAGSEKSGETPGPGQRRSGAANAAFAAGDLVEKGCRSFGAASFRGGTRIR